MLVAGASQVRSLVGRLFSLLMIRLSLLVDLECCHGRIYEERIYCTQVSLSLLR